MSDLSAVPVAQRQRMAFMLLPLGIVLLVAGVLPLLLASALLAKIGGLVVALVALLIVGVAYGLQRSARLDELVQLEQAVDEAILAGSGGGCGSDCTSCGVDDCAVKALPRS